jgi:hypothetical protein
LVSAPFNFWSAWSFKKFLQNQQPDLIRFHSLLRNLGGNVVKTATSFQQTTPSNLPKIWMMYHDLGYFTPYPSKVSAVSEIQTPLTFQHFLAWPRKKGVIMKIAVCCKYFWLKSLIKILKSSVDLHLVPSDFMESFLSEGLEISPKKVKVLHHFLQQ